jgi:hypothetical protein
VREIVSYMTANRTSNAPFDIAFAEGPDKSRRFIQPYAEAGVTWWMEGLGASLERDRERIRGGPPR